MHPSSVMRRLCLVAVAASLGAAVPLERTPVTPDDRFAHDKGIQATRDPFTRLMIPVMVNETGPYEFVVDTGADRSVISRELADTLHLPVGAMVTMHDIAGLQTIQTALIDHLAIGSRRVDAVEAPAIPAVDLGAQGMLGLDALRGQRVVMDFKAGRFILTAADETPDEPGAIIVEGKRRFGQLVLVDSETQGESIFVILDSGAESSIGNSALCRLVGQTRSGIAGRRTGEVISVTGRRTPADLNELPELRLGPILISHVPVAYADLHTFAQFGLANRPAMLLGMDALRLFARVTVDVRARQATFVER